METLTFSQTSILIILLLTIEKTFDYSIFPTLATKFLKYLKHSKNRHSHTAKKYVSISINLRGWHQPNFYCSSCSPVISLFILYITPAETTNAICIIITTKPELSWYAYWTAKDAITLVKLLQLPIIEDVKDLTDVGKYSEAMTKINQPITVSIPLFIRRTVNVKAEGMQK